MKHDPQLQVEVRDVAAGLWIWRLAHPAWKPNQGWEPVVASTCVESGGETLVLDPLAPRRQVHRPGFGLDLDHEGLQLWRVDR